MTARAKGPKPSTGRPPLYGKPLPRTDHERAIEAAAILAAQKPRSLIERTKAWFK